MGAAADRPTVHLVDDDAGMRRGLGRLLEAAGYAVREYASAGDFLLAEQADSRPACLLLDVRMPGPSGMELQQALARHDDPLPVVFLTGHGDIQMSVRALKSGAVDFLTKPVDRDTLVAAVESALAEDASRQAEREETNGLRERYERLTPREREVMAHVVAGRLNKQIASDIGAAERTVKAHRAQVMEKMEVASLPDLVRVAERLASVSGGASTSPEPAAPDSVSSPEAPASRRRGAAPPRRA